MADNVNPRPFARTKKDPLQKQRVFEK